MPYLIISKKIAQKRFKYHAPIKQRCLFSLITNTFRKYFQTSFSPVSNSAHNRYVSQELVSPSLISLSYLYIAISAIHGSVFHALRRRILRNVYVMHQTDFLLKGAKNHLHQFSKSWQSVFNGSRGFAVVQYRKSASWRSREGIVEKRMDRQSVKKSVKGDTKGCVGSYSVCVKLYCGNEICSIYSLLLPTLY